MNQSKKFNDIGLLDGITTNPSLLSKQNGDTKNIMSEIAGIIAGPVNLEVISTGYDEMLAEGKRLYEYGSNIIIKVPMTIMV